jgi:hypothetical protein
MEDGTEINPLDLDPQAAKNFFSNELKTSVDSEELQERLARGVGYVNAKLASGDMSRDEVGEMAVSIFNAAVDANSTLIDEGGNEAGFNESLLENTRQLLSLTFDLDLSQRE